jgi:hypothetical protein
MSCDPGAGAAAATELSAASAAKHDPNRQAIRMLHRYGVRALEVNSEQPFRIRHRRCEKVY